jgi:hypothetical protein
MPWGGGTWPAVQFIRKRTVAFHYVDDRTKHYAVLIKAWPHDDE